MRQRVDKTRVVRGKINKKKSQQRRRTSLLLVVILSITMLAGLVQNAFAQDEPQLLGDHIVTAEQPAEQPIVEPPVEQPAEPAAEQPAEPAAEQPAEPAAEEPAAEQPAEPAAAEPAAERPAEPAAEQPGEPAAEQPGEPAAEQPTEQPSEQPSEEPAAEPEKKDAEQPAEPSSEQPAPSMGVAVTGVYYTDPQVSRFITDAEINEPLRVAADFAVTDDAALSGTGASVRIRNRGANYFVLPENPSGIVEGLPAGAQNLAVALAPAANADGSAMLDGKGNQVYDINITFSMAEGSASGQVALAIPFDNGSVPADGSKLADITAEARKDGLSSAQAMEVISATRQKGKLAAGNPLKAPPAAPVEITKVTSTNAASFTTNKSNLSALMAEGTYSVNTPEGAAGTKITVKLSNKDAKKYFGAPDPSAGQVSLPAGASNLDITVSGTDVLVSFDITGDQFNSANFVVNFPFDHAAFDGWIPKSTPLADVTITAEKDGIASEKTLPVVSNTSDTRYFYTFSKSPAEDIPQGKSTTLAMTYANRYNNEVPSYWRNQPDTSYKIVVEYPKGAIAENLKALGAGVPGVDDPAAGTITWTLGNVGAGGDVTAGWSGKDGYGVETLRLTDLKFTFPADAFPAGTPVELKAYALYTLAGQATETKRSSAVLKFNITAAADIRMKPNSIKQEGSRALVSVVTPGQVTSQLGVSGIMNVGALAIPETRVVWHNDAGENKAKLNSIVVANVGAYFKGKLVFTVKNSTNGAGRELTAYMDQAATLGGSAVFNISSLNLAAEEYVEQFVWYALDNPEQTVAQLNASNEARALPFGAAVKLYTRFECWPDKKFPNGEAIVHGDQSVGSFDVLWNDDSQPEDHTDPAPVFDGEHTYSVSFPPDASKQVVLYMLDTPNPVAWLEMQPNQNGTLTPGTDITLNLKFYNYSVGGVDNWKSPLLYLLPPTMMTVDASGPLELYKGAAKVGTASITETTLPTGAKMYTIDPGALNLPKLASSSGCHVIPVTFHIKEGTAAGTYNFATSTGAGYPQTGGMLFTGSSLPFNFSYPADVATNSRYYNDSVTNYDGKATTPYLRHSEQTVGVKVASSVNVAAYATLFNNTADGGAGAWQNVATPGAEATVPLNGTGRFRLEVQNHGNTYAGDVVLTDSLPGVGDGRGSMWDATLSGLTVQVFDNNGADVTASQGFDTAYTLKYSAERNPLPATFNANATLATAKSFQFKLDPAKRLPGGYKIVITGTVMAPATADISKIGEAAYNNFTMNVVSYTNATGETGSVGFPTAMPVDQRFVLVDTGTAKLEKSGFVFKDMNRNNKYDAGDLKYEGAVVELYRTDTAGKPEESPCAVTLTDAGGQYEFSRLPAADYAIRVIPAPSDGTYEYAAKGALDDNTASHVDTNGYSDKFTLSAGQELSLGVNAGLYQAHTVTFKMNDGTQGVFAEQQVTHGQKAVQPTPAPERTGYAFAGWFKEAACGNEWDFAADAVNTDVVLYAKWERMTLASGYAFKDYNDDGLFGATDQKYGEGELQIGLFKVTDGVVDPIAVAVANTKADGSYEFGEVDAGTYRVQPLLADNLYGYAKRDMAANGSHIDPDTGFSADIVVAKGSFTTMPVNIGIRPNAALYVMFEIGNKQVGDTTTIYENKHDITQPFTLTAGVTVPIPNAQHVRVVGNPTVAIHPTWDNLRMVYAFQLESATYTVTFDKNGGDTEAEPRTMSITYPEDKLSSMPAPPKRTGHTFDGWLMPDGKSRFSTDTLIEKDITVKADWTPDFYRLAFNANGAPGNAIPGQSLRMGSLAVEPSSPAWKGRSFAGWNTKPDGGGLGWIFTKTTMPGHDVTLYAQWKVVAEPTPTPKPADPPAPTPTPGDPAKPTTAPKPEKPVTPPAPTPANPAGPTPTPANPAGPTPTPVITVVVPPPPVPTATPSQEPVEPAAGLVTPAPTDPPSGERRSDVGEEQVPAAGIGSQKTPRYGFDGGAWALLNLLLTILTGVIMLVLLIGYFAGKKREKDDRDERYARTRTYRRDRERGDRESSGRKGLLRLFSIIPLAVAAIVFLLTEDMRLPMVLVDQWTLLMAVIAAVQVLILALAGRKDKNEDDPEEEDKVFETI